MNEETQNNHTNSDQGTSLSPNSESLQTNDARIRNGNFSNNAAYEVSGSSTSNNDVIDTSRTFFAQNTTDDNVTPANYSPPNYISDDGTENDVVPYTPRPPSGPPPAYSPPAGGHGLPIPPPYCEEDVPVSMQIVPTRHHVVRFFFKNLCKCTK